MSTVIFLDFSANRKNRRTFHYERVRGFPTPIEPSGAENNFSSCSQRSGKRDSYRKS